MLGERYPAIVRTRRSAWPEFTPYLAFPPAIRTVVYSTNMVEPQGHPEPDCQSPRSVESFLCGQPHSEAGSVLAFVVDRTLEVAHAV
ncbi:transposase [Streptomyces sp. H27-H5]|nr:transposase [Streptomyces sp. H27-H5]MCY0963124.1 transposase [Streptomyces sp. H27-H5]